MQIIILHGNDTIKSYDRLTKFINEAKKRGWDIVNDKIEDTPSLFETQKLIIIRDYKIIKGSDLVLIKKIPGTLVIYNAGLIPTLALKNFNASSTEKFELPQKLWKFLDNMTVRGLHELLETEAIEFILAMIAWKLKQKYMRNPSKEVGLMISALTEIDVKAKTGKGNLLYLLELFIIKLKL